MPPTLVQNVTSMNTVGAVLAVPTNGSSTVVIQSNVNNNVTWIAEGTADGLNYIPTPLTLYPLNGGAGTAQVSNLTGTFFVVCGGLVNVRVRVIASGAQPLAGFTLNADSGLQAIYTIAQASTATASTSVKFRNLAGIVQQVKAIGGTLYDVAAVNNSVTAAYIQVFNALASSVTLGVTTPDYEVYIPSFGSNSLPSLPGNGIAFGTAISIASTTTEAGSVGSPNGVQATVQYL